MIASIPAPPFDSLDIGPLSLNIYGLMIALGVIAAVWMFGRRLEQRGVGTTDDASAIAIGAVFAGVVGARLYHVATDWDRFEDDLGKIPAIWEGGLGIPGGLLLGIPVGLWLARRRGISIADAATCAAPAIPLAQAIGRWGNYFNQELYGRPTDLPWALEVDAEHLAPGYAPGTTFHPTFLYESLWNLLLVVVLLRVDKKWRPGGGSLMGLYLAGYGLGRFWVEGLRIDRADELAGLRWNQWVALGAIVLGVALFVVLRRRAAAAAVPAHDAARSDLLGEDLGEVTDLNGDDELADEPNDGEDANQPELDDDEPNDGEDANQPEVDDDEPNDGEDANQPEVDDDEPNDGEDANQPDDGTSTER